MPIGIHLALNILQPLTGMRGTSGSVWTLSHKTGAVNTQMASPDTIGMTMQVVVLIAALLLTEYYIRKNGSKLQQKEGQKITEKERTVIQ